MSTIDDMELINKFVEDSLNKEELQLFNLRYREDLEFAELSNTYFDMSIAIKAADQFSRTKVKDRKDNLRYIADYKWVASIAASMVLIITLTIYTIHLTKENRLLSGNNNELSGNISKLKQEMAGVSKPNHILTITTNPIVATNDPEKVTDGKDEDQRVFAAILALNQIAESNANKNITRNSDGVAHVFPIQSKLINKDDAYLSILSPNQLRKAIKFRLIDFANNDTILRIEKISKDVIPLNISGIQSGGKYLWIITNRDGSIESGSIIVLPEIERKKVRTFSLNTGNDYLEAFIYYYKNEYYFEAQSVLKKANSRYHNEELFNALLKTLHNTKTL
jgi:hypothetical protein